MESARRWTARHPPWVNTSLVDFAALMARFGPPPGLVALGVSGGPDSLALALLARDWGGARLLALVVDHGLRAGSGAEAAHVQAMLAGQGIAARVLRLGLAPGPALQERARAARHAALLAACGQAGAPWLLLGHQRRDQAETVLLRARHGSGRAGLAGMAPVRAAAEAVIIRPLLDVPPAALEAVCAAAGLTPVRDPSNNDSRFTRVALRAGLSAPVVDALALGAAALGQARGRAEAALAARFAEAAALYPHGAARLRRAALGDDATARALLGRLLRVVGGAAHAPPEAAVAALLSRGQGTLGGAWWRPDGWLIREPGACAAPVPAEAGALWDGRFRLRAGLPGAMLGALGAWRGPGPAAWRAGLPAIRHDGRLLAVPHLGLGAAALDFAPRGGPLLAGDWSKTPAA